MNSRTLLWIGLPLGLLLLLLIGVGMRLASDSPGEESGPRRGQGGGAIAVIAEPIERGSIRDIRSLTGSLNAPRQFSVATEVSGRLVQLKVDVGDTVRPGDLIARIEDEALAEEVVRAEAELAVARANLRERESDLALAQTEVSRLRQLRDRDITSQADLDTAEARVRAMESSVEVAEATILQRESSLRAARLRLSYTRIKATWEGEEGTRVVGERFVTEGSNLAANQSIVSLLDLDELRATVQVTERDYARIGVGQEGTLRVDALPDQTFTATVDRKAPLFRESSRRAQIEMRIPNPDHALLPGMFARIQLVLAEYEDVVLVPREALVRREQEQGVFVLEREEDAWIARFVQVTPGVVERDRLQLRDSTLSGEVVVVGQDQLIDGARVRRDESSAPGDGSGERDNQGADED